LSRSQHTVEHDLQRPGLEHIVGAFAYNRYQAERQSRYMGLQELAYRQPFSLVRAICHVRSYRKLCVPGVLKALSLSTALFWMRNAHIRSLRQNLLFRTGSLHREDWEGKNQLPRNQCSFAYSAWPSFRMGNIGSASFHRAKKSGMGLLALKE